MFDDLDDPMPSAPGPEVKAAVLRRGRQLRRRRQMLVAAGSVGAVVLIAAGLAGGITNPLDPQDVAINPPPAPSNGALPPSPSSQQPTRPTTTRTGTTSPGSTPPPGLPTCSDTTTYSTASPVEGLDIALEVESPVLLPSALARGAVVVTNTTTSPITFFHGHVGAARRRLVAAGTTRVVGGLTDLATDADHQQAVTLEPGASHRTPFALALLGCPGGAATPLPAGEYDLQAGIVTRYADQRLRVWLAPAARLQLLPVVPSPTTPSATPSATATASPTDEPTPSPEPQPTPSATPSP